MSHHDEFFTKLRTLVEVETPVLTAWWRREMLLCKYVLRAIIASVQAVPHSSYGAAAASAALQVFLALVHHLIAVRSPPPTCPEH